MCTAGTAGRDHSGHTAMGIMNRVIQHLQEIDWLLVVPIMLIMALGLVTNIPVDGFSFDSLFFKQSLFVLIALGIILLGSMRTYIILRGPLVSLVLFLFSVIVLVALLLFAPEINGARSWFILFNSIAVQPVELIKILLIITLARYFATRHIHIQHIRHVIISLVITLVPFFLVFFSLTSAHQSFCLPFGQV